MLQVVKHIAEKITVQWAAFARSVPVILQHESADCGAACVAMAAASFGNWVPLHRVRESCGSARDGSSVADLIRTARSCGIEAEAFNVDIDELDDLGYPQILFWNCDHFVVLEGRSRRGHRIVDPAVGRRTVSRQEFSDSYTGVTIALSKSDEPFQSERPPGYVNQIARIVDHSKGAMTTVVASGVIALCLGIVVPGFVRVFIDEYLVGGQHQWLFPLLGAMLVLGVIQSFAAYLQNELATRLQNKLAAVLGASFVWKMLHLPFEFISARRPGELAARGQLAGQLGGTVSGPVVQAVTGGVAAAIYLAIMLTTDVLLTATVSAIAILQLLTLWASQRALREATLCQQVLSGRAHATIIQGVGMLEQYRATGADAKLFDRLMHAHSVHLNAEQRAGRVAHVVSLVPFVGSRLLSIAVLGVGALQVIQTELTMGSLIAFIMISELFTSALSAIANLGTTAATLANASERLGEVTRGPSESATANSSEGRAGVIKLTDVSFSYRGGASILDSVTLECAPGQQIGIAGASAAGKSTLARIAAGVMSPLRGTVESGVERGYVDQNPFLPAGSLRGALTLWNASARDEDVRAALEDAQIAAVVSRRPGGIDGRIGEGGSDFSGGEVQRLAIARALAGRPDVVILDDGTSACDEGTEAAVLECLRRRGVTVLLMSNRASALSHMDAVWELREGRLYPSAQCLGSTAPERKLMSA